MLLKIDTKGRVGGYARPRRKDQFSDNSTSDRTRSGNPLTI